MDPRIVSQLRDIRGLDPMPWWHIAPGWFVVAALLVLLSIFLYWWLSRPPKSRWQEEAERELRRLRKRLRRESNKNVLSDFSELLRRIAMAKHGRESCAGLYGEDWLQWLHEHDPKGFRWQDEARLLLNLAYAPPTTEVEPATVRKLLDATQVWVQAR
jgi:hypothetical protein